ncbi:MAG TPA: ribose 5-phosphate isomerase B [Planctomycetota bacterium]|nr:ribose 5-phosphate isomerase B [Planctomycetota bacterium]
MKIAIGSDHAGFDAKEKLKARLAQAGHEVRDVGAHSTASVDYPDPARDVASLVAKGEVERGVLVCGSGIGMSIAANKVHGARAALVTDEWHAEMARRHNDANIICVGGRVNADEALGRFVDRFILTAFEGGRHATRVGKITALEK